MSAMKCGGMWAPQYLSVFTGIAETLISVSALIGNILIVFVVAKDPFRKLHNPFNYFVVNLAVADLVVGVICGPIAVYTHVLEYQRKLDNISAQIIHIGFFVSVTASILSLVTLSADRYVAITFPLKYRKYLSWRRCWCISAIIWILSLTIPFIYFEVGFIDYLMIYANAGVLIILIIMIFIYVRIYLFLRKNTQNMKSQLRTSSTAQQEFVYKRMIMEKKVTRVFLVVLAIFIVTYLPATILIYVLDFCPKCACNIRHWLRDLIFLLIAFNSCANPIIYARRLKHFRKAIGFYLKRCLCFEERVNVDGGTIENHHISNAEAAVQKCSST